MEDSSGQNRASQTIATPAQRRSSTWKYFGFYTVNGTTANKDMAVW